MSVILERRRSHARKRRGSVIAGRATASMPRKICFLSVHYKKTRGDILVTAEINKHQIYNFYLAQLDAFGVCKQKIKQLYHILKQNNRLSMSDILCLNNFVGQHIDIKINHCIKPEFREIVNGKGEKMGKITFRLADDLEKKCKKNAKTFGVPVSEYIRKCIEAGPSIKYHFERYSDWKTDEFNDLPFN